MNRLALKTKLIAVVVTGGVVLSSGSLAFAASNSKETTTTANTIAQSHKFGGDAKCNGVGMGAKFEAQLKAAVTANVITQVESDNILAYRATLKGNEQKPVKTDRGDIFSALVTNKIITQAKADALKANIQAQNTLEEKQNIDTKLKAFVADKIITQDQADKLATISHKGGMEQDCIKDKDVEFETQLKSAVTSNVITQEDNDKILAYKDMPKEEDGEFVKHDLFTDLVTKDIITQAKADALKANIQEQKTLEENQNLAAKLKAFVADKIITQDQADKIAVAITAAKVSPLEALVTDGTITQAQVDQLATLSHKVGMKHQVVKGESENDSNKNGKIITPAVKQ